MTKQEIGQEIEKAILEKKISYRQIRELTGLNHDQVKKPDYLGVSMWGFKDAHKSIPVRMSDIPWLTKFQKRKVDIRPGDSLRGKLRTVINYGHDNQAISTNYEITEVLEVLPLNTPNDRNIFNPDSSNS